MAITRDPNLDQERGGMMFPEQHRPSHNGPSHLARECKGIRGSTDPHHRIHTQSANSVLINSLQHHRSAAQIKSLIVKTPTTMSLDLSHPCHTAIILIHQEVATEIATCLSNLHLHLMMGMGDLREEEVVGPGPGQSGIQDR